MTTVTITSIGPGIWAAAEGQTFRAAIRRYGEHFRVLDPEGAHLGDLFRSDGKIQGSPHTADCSQSADDCHCLPVVAYTYRAYLVSGPEVARGADMATAVAAILDGHPAPAEPTGLGEVDPAALADEDDAALLDGCTCGTRYGSAHRPPCPWAMSTP